MKWAGGALLAASALAGAAFSVGTSVASTTPGTYLDGPPPGFSGGYGEDSCHACHFSAEPNEPPGGITVEGFPEEPVAGSSYLLQVTLARPGMMRAGFQMTVRSGEEGEQAGRMVVRPDDVERIRVTEDRGIQYAYQLRAGSIPVTSDTARWSVRWTAPEGAGEHPVRLHVAGNAADGDESSSGDYIYTASLESTGSKD